MHQLKFLFVSIFLLQAYHTNGTPITLDEQLKQLQQDLALINNLRARRTQEINLQKLTLDQKLPIQNLQELNNKNSIQQKRLVENSSFGKITSPVPTAVTLEAKSAQEIKPTQNVQNALQNLTPILPQNKAVTLLPPAPQNIVQQLPPNIPQFNSLSPNALSGINNVRVPFPYNTIRIPHPVPVPVHIKVPVTVEKPYPVQVTKTIAVPVEKPVYIRIPQPIQVPVAQPYPVLVPQPVEVRVPHPVYIRVLPNGQQFIVNNFLKNN